MSNVQIENVKPYEILAAPYTAYVAEQAVAKPKLIETEAAIVAAEESGGKLKKWHVVGTSGDLNYSEAGVTVSHPQTIQTFQSAGSTIPRKAWRTDEGFEVAFEMADMSPVQYALVMDNLTVTVTAGVSGTAGNYAEESFNLKRGPKVYAYALYMRGQSPVEKEFPSAFYVPGAYQGGNPTPKFALKGGGAMLALQFVALEFVANEFAEFIAATGPQ